MKKGFGAIVRHFRARLDDAMTHVVEATILRRRDARVIIKRTLARRDRLFFKKEKPQSKEFPYQVLDPYEIYGELVRFSDFSLVGDAWLRRDESLPVAMAWGFNNWKWGFSTEYLKSYRVAFAPRKITSIVSLLAIWRFPERPDLFVYWGYTEPRLVRFYAKIKKIPVLRVEDGFLRSSSLGASHSVPYSLVLDPVGLHYDPTRASNLELTLNNGYFSSEDLEDARRCLQLMKQFRLSKYNPPVIESHPRRAIQLKKRVAVIGQVDNDMSMRMGNVNGWSMIDLIMLAKYENPDAEIVYRPHPDVYAGYQKSKFAHRVVSRLCALESPSVPMVDFLESVDHLYVVTSLTGLEGLLYGKEVTVVGAAFYAGWGLTDDRLEFPRRTAVRTLEELFHAVYLSYPKYLASSEPVKGFMAACLRISADRAILQSKLAREQAGSSDSLAVVAGTKFWPVFLFFNRQLPFNSVMSAVDWRDVFAGTGPLEQSFLLHAVAGRLEGDASRGQFCTRVRQYVEKDAFFSFLLNWRSISQCSEVARQLAWALADQSNDSAAHATLDNRLNRLKSAQATASLDASAKGESGENAQQEGQYVDHKWVISGEQHEILLEKYELAVHTKSFSEALNAAWTLLLGGHVTNSILLKVAKLAETTFDVRSARGLARMSNRVDMLAENRKALSVCLSALPEDASRCDLSELQRLMALTVALNPERINVVLTIAKSYFSDPELMQEVASAMLNLDNEITIQKATAYLELGQTNRALSVVKQILADEGESDKVRVMFAKVLADLGRWNDALGMLNAARDIEPSETNFKESLRLLSIVGRFGEAKVIIDQAADLNVDVGDAFIMPTLLANNDIEAAYKSYLNVPFRRQMMHYYPSKYWDGQETSELTNALILAVYGPGDEIRFASVYNDILLKLGASSFKLTCDYRLHEIMQRSFPDIRFVPVRRSRSFSSHYPRSLYDQLPGADLCNVLDNDTIKDVDSADQMLMVTDLLWRFRYSYASFSRKSYLTVDETQKSRFASRIPGQHLRVGICWRSSLTTRSRNVHYLDVDNLVPLFEIDGIQFVNLQYDDCTHELAWLEERFPGKIVNFDEVDQYNDFDSVAGIMSNLDLVIAPATTVAEFAAALGCHTWLFACSAEVDWRKVDDSGADVWHSNARVIGGDGSGDKGVVVKRLEIELLALLARKQEASIASG